MAEPISALEHNPHEFIREVSPEAINFYVNGLGGIFLPDNFRKEHAGLFDVRYWNPSDRLWGKFGRFAVMYGHEEDRQPLDDVLLMGTTIGLSGLSSMYYGMEKLSHVRLPYKLRDVLKGRGFEEGDPITVHRADYGTTEIRVGEDGTPKVLAVGGASGDFGRARAEGRVQTCDLFRGLLGGMVEIINADPVPIGLDRILAA